MKSTTRSDTYAVRLSPEHAKRLRAIAKAEERSVTGLVRLIVAAWLEDEDREP